MDTSPTTFPMVKEGSKKNPIEEHSENLAKSSNKANTLYASWNADASFSYMYWTSRYGEDAKLTLTLKEVFDLLDNITVHAKQNYLETFYRRDERLKKVKEEYSGNGFKVGRESKAINDELEESLQKVLTLEEVIDFMSAKAREKFVGTDASNHSSTRSTVTALLDAFNTFKDSVDPDDVAAMHDDLLEPLQNMARDLIVFSNIAYRAKVEQLADGGWGL